MTSLRGRCVGGRHGGRGHRAAGRRPWVVSSCLWSCGRSWGSGLATSWRSCSTATASRSAARPQVSLRLRLQWALPVGGNLAERPETGACSVRRPPAPDLSADCWCVAGAAPRWPPEQEGLRRVRWSRWHGVTGRWGDDAVATGRVPGRWRRITAAALVAVGLTAAVAVPLAAEGTKLPG